MPDNVTGLLKKDHKPYKVTKVTFAKDVLSSFQKVVDHVDGIIVMDKCLTLEDHSLSIMVLRGHPFYPGFSGTERYCKEYNIQWKNRLLATITMKVESWSSRAIVCFMDCNIAWRETVRDLESWKLMTRRLPSSPVPLVQNIWKMPNDTFFHMTEFL